MYNLITSEQCIIPHAAYFCTELILSVYSTETKSWLPQIQRLWKQMWQHGWWHHTCSSVNRE